MQSPITAAGAVLGGLTVAFGAFGAHALKGRLDAEAAAWFEKAVHYQGLHAVALLGVGALAARTPAAALRGAARGFVAGTVLFCGSLYAMALGAPRALGAVTPVGGVGFLVGWACLAAWAARKPAAG